MTLHEPPYANGTYGGVRGRGREAPAYSIHYCPDAMGNIFFHQRVSDFLSDEASISTGPADRTPVGRAGDVILL
jgi:hypothetical protein